MFETQFLDGPHRIETTGQSLWQVSQDVQACDQGTTEIHFPAIHWAEQQPEDDVPKSPGFPPPQPEG